ncbi:polysaccharide pyruvyl transferase family protein [Priestia sp. RMT2NF4]|uniref:polysaccharide pyruvyl transferase family protein n=1 Tax=Priestia sp. RMT2NF4 TaxID=3398394 RepID=UPI003A4C81C9
MGDDAILENIIESIYRQISSAQFCVISRGLFPAYRGSRNIEVIKIDSFSLVREKIRMADVVIVGGGGILQDYSGWTPQKEVGRKAKGMNYYGQVIDIAHKYRKKIYYYSIGIGPFFSSESINYACSLLSTATRVTVRDTESYQFITKNLPKMNVIQTADPALNLQSISPTKSRELLKLANIPLEKKLVGICLRSWRFKENEEIELLDNIARLGDLLSKTKNVHLVLLSLSQYTGDKKIIRMLAKQLPKRSYTLIRTNYPPKILKGILGEFSLMIGMRLHSLILSASMGVPVIGISYDPKVDYFTHLLKPNIFSFPYQALHPQNLYNLSIELLNMSNQEKNIFQKSVLHLKETEKLNTEFLFGGEN